MAAKIMIKRTIPQGVSRDLFLLLLEQMRAIASIQPGYFYGETLQSASSTEVVIVISTWKSIHSWHSWIACRERMILQSKIDAILGTPTEYTVYCHMGSTDYETATVGRSAGMPEDPPVDLPQACFAIDPAYGSAAV